MEPLCRYRVRTPRWVLAVVVAVVLGALAACAWITREFRPPPGPEALRWALDGMVAGLAVLVFWASRAYRVAADSSIDVYPDRVEIPRPWRGHDVFPFAGLIIRQVHLIQHLTAFHVATVARLDRGTFVTFRRGAVRRTLSERTFVAPGTLRFLLDDLAAIGRGEPARGPDGWSEVFAAMDRLVAGTPGAAASRDPYEARLDAELRDS